MNFVKLCNTEVDVRLYNNILDDDVCDYLIKFSKHNFTPATIITNNESRLDDTFRKCDVCYIDQNDPTVFYLRNLASNMTKLPIENVEPIQIVRYNPGGMFEFHHDCFMRDDIVRESDRKYTIIFYLNSVNVGGETLLPNLDLSIKPVKGNALMFTNIDEKNKILEDSLHKGNTIFNEVKYIATCWVWNKKYG